MTRFRRTQTKKASAILSADWHLRPDIPIGRIDDYFGAMEKKLDFILDLSKQHDCPILVAGDLGNHALNNGWPTWLLEWIINKFKGHDIMVIPGQHDLPNHQISQFDKSGMGVLDAAGVIKTIGIIQKEGCVPTGSHLPLLINSFFIIPFPYSMEMKYIGWDEEYQKKMPMMAMTHQMVIENKEEWPGQKAVKGHQLLKQFPEYDLILSGDNHQAFTVEYQGRVLVNPGSMMRNTAAQIDHKPRVYLWYAETNEIEAVYLPIEHGVIDRSHIDNVQERDTRMDAFIQRVKKDIEIQLAYEKNLENYFQKYRTERPIKEKTWAAVI